MTPPAPSPHVFRALLSYLEDLHAHLDSVDILRARLSTIAEGHPSLTLEAATAKLAARISVLEDLNESFRIQVQALHEPLALNLLYIFVDSDDDIGIDNPSRTHFLRVDGVDNFTFKWVAYTSEYNHQQAIEQAKQQGNIKAPLMARAITYATTHQVPSAS